MTLGKSTVRCPVSPSSAKVQTGRQDCRREDRDGKSRKPLSDVPSPAAPAYDENAALRVGRTLFVKGDVTAAEDLLIRGRVIGSIHVDDHVLTVGRGGNVTAKIVAPKIVVQGYVAGDVELDEQLVITPGGMVVGDVKAPSIVIQDGGTLRQIPDPAERSTSNEPIQARTANPARGQKGDKDEVAPEPPLKPDPRESIGERGRVSPVAA